MLILKIIGGALLLGFLGLAAFGADALWNESGVFYRLIGRDALIGECAPPTQESLTGKGFTPTDLTFGSRPSISISKGTIGQSRTLSDEFNFSDGLDGQRIDGTLVCIVSGHAVHVEVHVDRLPIRAT